uniref:Uncharacterized protein n=1 Tax=Vespula pensylvanica TaxID=30213 RepID=A0A834UBS4_VESPE|nr:hypothetical protein H0235_005635 [Vespula pensylvanica]
MGPITGRLHPLGTPERDKHRDALTSQGVVETSKWPTCGRISMMMLTRTDVLRDRRTGDEIGNKQDGTMERLANERERQREKETTMKREPAATAAGRDKPRGNLLGFPQVEFA